MDTHVVSGGADHRDITRNADSIGEFIITELTKSGNAIAMIDGVTSSQLSFITLRDQSIRLAKYLTSTHGIKNGDVISIVSENRLEYPVVFCAALFCGATLAPLNMTYTERELEHAVNQSKPRIIFVSPYVVERVSKVAKTTSFIDELYVFGNETPHKGYKSFSNIIAGKEVVSDFRPKAVDIHKTVALILCSSGTTGLPKGVQLSQYNVMVSAGLVKHGILSMDISKDEIVVLGLIPWFHAFGCLVLISMLCNDTKTVLLPRFEEALLLSSIEKYQISLLLMVPPLMVFLAKHPLVDKYNLSCVKEIICGAAPLSKDTEEAVRKRIKVPTIRQGYGMSELTLSVLLQKADKRKPGSVGFVMPGTYAKVIDPESGMSLGPNKPGELCFCGSQIMNGYIGDAKATKDTIDERGWLHTGDVGYYDNDQEFFIIDRLKELIKYKGFQVPPAEVEGILLAHSKIRDAAVVGVPDEKCGELPIAFVVKQPNVQLTAKEVIEFVAGKTSPAKRLHGGVRFIEEIPKNPSGKILRRELRAMLTQPRAKL